MLRKLEDDHQYPSIFLTGFNLKILGSLRNVCIVDKICWDPWLARPSGALDYDLISDSDSKKWIYSHSLNLIVWIPVGLLSLYDRTPLSAAFEVAIHHWWTSEMFASFLVRDLSRSLYALLKWFCCCWLKFSVSKLEINALLGNQIRVDFINLKKQILHLNNSKIFRPKSANLTESPDSHHQVQLQN